MSKEELTIKLNKLTEAHELGILTDEEYQNKYNELNSEEVLSSSPVNSAVEEESDPEQENSCENQCSDDKNTESVEDDGIVYFDNDNKSAESGNISSENPGVFKFQNQDGNINSKKTVDNKEKNGKNKKLIIGGIVLVLLLIGIVKSCGDNDTTSEVYDWPTDDKIAAMLPEPDGDVTYISISHETDMESLDATIEISDSDECGDYIDACKEKGFSNIIDSYISNGEYDYTATNEDGWELSVYNFDDEMTITLWSPGYVTFLESDIDDEQVDAEDSDVDSSNDAETDYSSSDFRDTMDEYEDFMDDYIEFMEKYNDSDDTVSMMSDYADMLKEYSEFAKKIDAIDEDSLTDSDAAYYVEVTTRVSKKLLEADID